jgi:hypothetical protein
MSNVKGAYKEIENILGTDFIKIILPLLNNKIR